MTGVDKVDDRGRREGVIVDVIEHRTHQTVGRFFNESGIAYVVPENARINHEVLVPEEHIGEAYHGQYVVVDILRQPTMRTKPTGRFWGSIWPRVWKLMWLSALTTFPIAGQRK